MLDSLKTETLIRITHRIDNQHDAIISLGVINTRMCKIERVIIREKYNTCSIHCMIHLSRSNYVLLYVVIIPIGTLHLFFKSPPKT